ncbi:MAG: histidinol-phosphate transaminase [Kiritimatiellae bacterium]|nr:histidinol-phosphate transaminase [Kiritimatiellia bacterium]MDW8458077.1 histidinol-phosphate transaminase [Verrucomicrobiota bacterium]
MGIRASVSKLQPYTPGEQPRVPGLIKLNTNENPYPPSPRVAEALRQIAAEGLRLYPDPLAADLRAEIAHLHGCAPENVFAGNGSDEILALCTRAFVEPQGEIAWFDPSYSLYPVLAAIADTPARAIPLTNEFRLPPIEVMGLRSVSLMFVTVPNAPTGLAYPRPEIEAICRAVPGVVVLDEAYVDFAPESFADLALRLPNVLVTRSFSKSYSLAGLRLGYAIGPRPLIEALFKIKDSYNIDAIAQRLGIEAVRDQAWMRANADRIIATRGRVADALAALGWKVLPSAANFLFARPPGGDAAGIFAKLRARNILVRHFPGPRTGEYLRITIGTDEQMDALLAALRA